MAMVTADELRPVIEKLLKDHLKVEINISHKRVKVSLIWKEGENSDEIDCNVDYIDSSAIIEDWRNR